MDALTVPVPGSGAADVAHLREPQRPSVEPFARALALLCAFTVQDRWLTNRELVARTSLPAPTVTRLTHSLVKVGYLLHDPDARKYRLAAAVLSLGYAAFANSNVQRVARTQMQAFAVEHHAHLILCSRYRLDLIVRETCGTAPSRLSSRYHIGARVEMATSPMGWALLAALPESERHYLLSSVERHRPPAWPRLYRRACEAIAQVYDKGFFSATSDCDPSVGVIAVPVLIESQDPLVLACLVASSQMSRTRVERELAPRLLAMGGVLQQADAGP